MLFKGDNEGQIPTSVSQDGRTLLFTAAKPGTRLDVFALTMDGSHQPTPLIATRLAEAQAQLSPDGRWVAYTEQEVGGRPEVFRPRPSNGGRRGRCCRFPKARGRSLRSRPTESACSRAFQSRPTLRRVRSRSS